MHTNNKYTRAISGYGALQLAAVDEKDGKTSSIQGKLEELGWN